MTAATAGLFGREIFTPSSLAATIQKSFDRDLGAVWVEGEIAELSLPPSGHAYFSLKDGQARLKAVMWKGRRPYAGAALAEGLSVLARGRLAVYAPRGEFQLVADYLEPRGEGALRLAFERLKARLEREGLFDPERKRPLPFWPRRVAVVSSPAGAAVRDFMQTARARRPGAEISLYPVRVQGDGAAGEIAEALADLNAWGGFDLIVLTRGGGSLSDLWAFNEEAVVRVVAASRTPTLAAIGHSTDLSLAELAADHRAITPTAAAEAVFRDRAALVHHVEGLRAAALRSLALALEGRRERLAAARRRLTRGLTGTLTGRRYRFAYLSKRLEHFGDRLERDSRKLAALDERLRRAVRERLAEGERLLDKAVVRLHDLSPESVLRRGYALVSRGGRPVASAAALAAGEEVGVRLADGAFTAIITGVESRS